MCIPFISDCRDISEGQLGINTNNIVDIQSVFKVQVSQRNTVSSEFSNLSEAPSGVNKDNLCHVKCAQKFPSSSKFQLCYFNAQSAGGKSLSISDYICDNKIDLCCMTESWLKEGDTATEAELKPDGYYLQNKPRQDRDGGGIAIIYRSTINPKLVSYFETSSFECGEWLVPLSKDTLRLIILYRPPYSRAHPVTERVFFEEFSEQLESWMLSSGSLLIMGDFNIHVEDPSDCHGKRLLNILASCGLSQHVIGPTHKDGGTLDLVITRDDDTLLHGVPHVDYRISDHDTILMKIKDTKPVHVVKEISYRKFDDIDIDEFRSDLSQSDLCKNPPESLDLLVEKYNTTMAELIDKYAPLKNKKVDVRQMQPWFTHDIKVEKQYRRKLERQSKKTNLQTDNDAFKTQKNKVNFMLKEARTGFFSNMIKENGSDQRALFKISKSLLGQKQENPLPPHDTAGTLANDFGEFFNTKIRNIMDYLDGIQPDCPAEPDPPRTVVRPLHDFRPVTEEEVKEIISSSPPKSCDLDPLPTNVLKQLLDVLLPVITLMINLSLRQGYFPDAWKIALIIPLLKKLGLDLIFKNFRPVSNLVFLSKVCEKVVAIQFKDHCLFNDLYVSLQSAYRDGHSTETALLKVQNDILRDMDQDRVVLVLLLDLSAAFDTVSHDILLKRLSTMFGINGTALAWFESYLKGRHQSVIINGEKSDPPQSLQWGVPQGSVLGPLLFTAYTSPLSDIAVRHAINIHLYADDTQPYLSFRPSVSLAEEQAVAQMGDFITDLRKWMAVNTLKLNDDKTVFLLVGRNAQVKKVSIDSFRIGESIIPKSDTATNLGVHWDSELSLKKQVEKTCKSAFYHLRNIYRIRKCLSQSDAETLVHAYITSRLDYCNSLYVNLPEYLIQDLQMVQNAAARLVVGLRKFDHISQSRMDLHWLPVKQRIDFKVLLLTYKAVMGEGPQYLADMFIPTGSDYSLRSDYKDQYKVPKSKKKCCGDRAFSIAAPKLWNDLPQYLKYAHDVTDFKANLKTHLFRIAYNV